MAEVKKLSFMQLNSPRLSNAKRIALEIYIDDMKPDFKSLNKTKQWFSHNIFRKYRMFPHHQLTYHRGVALFLPKDVSCCEIPTFQEETLDSIWWAVYLVSQPAPGLACGCRRLKIGRGHGGNLRFPRSYFNW